MNVLICYQNDDLSHIIIDRNDSYIYKISEVLHYIIIEKLHCDQILKNDL